MSDYMPYAGVRRRGVVIAVVGLSAVVCLVWAMRHAYNIALDSAGVGHGFAFLWLVVFVLVAHQIVLSWFERPYTVTWRQQRLLDQMTVSVNVPVYNEDPALLDRCLRSLAGQTRLPDRIEVVDDGSDSPETYDYLRAYWNTHMPKRIHFSWVRTHNRGKRHAQVQTFRHDHSDIHVTVDSDTVLDHNAIDEGLKPFADSRVQSVAGLEMALNLHENLLTRIHGLHQLMWQFTTRASQSVLGQVLVNCGTFALYRGAVIRENVDAYLGETFLGREVAFSDDALLAMYARDRGKTVQQPSAIQFAAYPNKWSHSARQWVRWMRGAAIRDLWRLRYLPMTSYGFWTVIIAWVQFFLGGIAYVVIAMEFGSSLMGMVALVLIPIALSYLQLLRYLTFYRSDETATQHFVSFLLSPLVFVRWFFFFKPLRIYGLLTCWKTTWGTRSKVEVVAAGAARAA